MENGDEAETETLPLKRRDARVRSGKGRKKEATHVLAEKSVANTAESETESHSS